MLTHPTLDKLQTLKLSGMYHALVEQGQMADIAALSFEERFGLLVDRELTERDTRRLTTRLRQAKLHQTACIEHLDYRHPRGLDKALITRLATCQWVREHHNVLITGPTGIGQTWLGCALGHKACREGFTALYLRLPRFLQELPIAKGDGRYGKLMATLARYDVLILRYGNDSPENGPHAVGPMATGRQNHESPQNSASRFPAILTGFRANRDSYPLRGFLNTRPWPGMIQSAIAKTCCRLASSVAWSQASGSVSGVISSSHQR